MKEARNFVALGTRVSGTAGAKRAANYIAARLESTGIENRVDVFTNATPHGSVVFRNVIGTIAGQDARTVIIAGHYDTKGRISERFVGANDSGSSTGLMLALAEHLKSTTLPFTLAFAFFDGEECAVHYGPGDGLHGSRHLANSLEPDDVHAVIVVDMIGDRDLNVTIPRNSSPFLVSAVFDAARVTGARKHFSLHTGTILDDHVPFLDRGFAAIDLIDFEFGSEPGKNDYWHTNEDTMYKISAESLEIVGRVVLQLLNALPPVSSVPGS